VGPLVFASYKGQALYIAAGLLGCGMVIALLFKPRAKTKTA
jgi:hypothetical protein